MTPTHTNRVEHLFNEAFKLPPEERRAFLDAQCGTNHTLLTEVEGLLAAYEPTFLGTPLTRLPDLDPHTFVGRQIEPYKLIDLIGQGGMGNVYLAERTDGVIDTNVAIKLVRQDASIGGINAEDISRSFQAETRIQGKLKHPNIAHLYDGGITEDGYLFFVMEYIEGEPITTYCDQNQLSIEKRLVLFSKVCRAVQYAHQNMVIHCDLKPSNILVTTEGEVKLLDFGIAKLLTQDEHVADAEESLHTLSGLLTPAYASPEQIEGTGVSQATDVYALGVLLYELLTGRRPYDFVNRLAQEIKRIIQEDPPTLPSTIVTQADSTQYPTANGTLIPATVSQVRATTVEKLRRRLSGDLDSIILKAMHKKPAARYSSMDQFREDIRRHLAHLPIIACQHTRAERIVKLWRRNKVKLVVVSLFVLVIVAGLASTFWQWRKAEERGDQARTAAAQSEQVTEYLLNVFNLADPLVANGETITARHLLENGVEQADDVEPTLQAPFLTVIGRAYRNLGLHSRSTETLKKALDIRKKTSVRSSLEFAESMNYLAIAYRIQQRYAEAESLFIRVLSIREALLGPHHEEVAAALNGLGKVYYYQFKSEQAEPLYLRAIAIHEALPEPNPAKLGSVLHSLAALYIDRLERPDEAKDLLERAVVLYEEAHGPEHSEVANPMNSLASLHRKHGNLELADSLLRRVLYIREKMLGPDHTEVAHGLNSLGVVLKDQKKYEEAEETYKRALRIREKALGPQHSECSGPWASS